MPATACVTGGAGQRRRAAPAAERRHAAVSVGVRVTRSVTRCGGAHVRSGVVRSGVLRSGVLRSGVLRSGVLRSGVLRSGVLRSRVLRSGVLRSGVRSGAINQRDPLRRNAHAPIPLARLQSESSVPGFQATARASAGGRGRRGRPAARRPPEQPDSELAAGGEIRVGCTPPSGLPGARPSGGAAQRGRPAGCASSPRASVRARPAAVPWPPSPGRRPPAAVPRPPSPGRRPPRCRAAPDSETRELGGSDPRLGPGNSPRAPAPARPGGPSCG